MDRRPQLTGPDATAHSTAENGAGPSARRRIGRGLPVSWLVLPGLALIAVFFIVPLGIMVARSLFDPSPLNYLHFVESSLYPRVLFCTLWMAALVTLLCLLVGYPFAYLMCHAGGGVGTLLAAIVLLPFWSSLFVRTYAWTILLRDTGLINTVLQSLHLIREPLPLLYNNGAVLLGLVYGYLPFMVLPIYATLERLDPALVEAAADLGARPLTTVWRVIVPLSMPGIRAGAILVFIPTLGAYLTPDLLGGGRTVLIGNLVQNQFTTARDWPFGAAVSIALMALVTLVLAVLLRRQSEPLV